MDDRSREQHAENVTFYRLSALEEAFKYQSGQMTELRDRIDHMPDRLEREFPSRLDLEREYVRKADLREAITNRRDTWTLRFLGMGQLLLLAGLALDIATKAAHH